MTDTVMVNTPTHGLEHWPLVYRLKKAVRLAHPQDGTPCVFALRDGRPATGALPRFRGYRLHKLEITRLADEAESIPASPRRSAATEIKASLLRQCPVRGYWRAFPEVPITVLGDEGKPEHRRTDVVYVETKATEGRLEPRLFGVEAKSGRADFISDSKWWSTVDAYHGFALVAPPGVIAPTELPARVGLYEWDGEETVEIRAPVWLEELPADRHLDTLHGVIRATDRRG